MIESQSEAVRVLLNMLSEKGRSIADCVPLLGRKASTLKRYAKQDRLSFPDYKPRY